MSLVLCALLGLAGWAALSLGLPKHFRVLRGRDPGSTERRSLRTFGWLALIAIFAVSFAAHGAEFGSVYAVLLLMLTALAWSLWLTRMTLRR